MSETIYSQPYAVKIPPILVAKDRQVGHNPENELISRLHNRLEAEGIKLENMREFGFDIPVSREEQAEGKRGYEYWVQVPGFSYDIPGLQVESFKGGNYLALRIDNPFAEPCARIPEAWDRLVKYIEEQQIRADDHHEAGVCLEEVSANQSMEVMTIYIRIKD